MKNAQPTPVWQNNCDAEYRMGMEGTKWQIFCCAIHYFAEQDYSSLSMRQLAAQVGIQASSIYHHFPSKEAILDDMYRYMNYYYDRYMPQLPQLLALAKTQPPRKVLLRTHYRYPQPLQQMMSKLILFCQKMMRTDERADTMLRTMLIDVPQRYIVTLLRDMVANRRILPVDVDAVAELYINIFYGASLRMYSSHPVDDARWDRAFTVLFDVLTPVEELPTAAQL